MPPLVVMVMGACQRKASDAADAATPADRSVSVDPAASTMPSGDVGAGTTPSDTPPARSAAGADTATPEEQQAATAQTSGDVANGWKQYEANCSRCHGQDALGSAIAPDLRESVKGGLDQGGFVQTVMDGRPEKGMPSFAKQLQPEQVSDIYAYVAARSSGKLSPGRPEG